MLSGMAAPAAWSDQCNADDWAQKFFTAACSNWSQSDAKSQLELLRYWLVNSHSQMWSHQKNHVKAILLTQMLIVSEVLIGS